MEKSNSRGKGDLKNSINPSLDWSLTSIESSSMANQETSAASSVFQNEIVSQKKKKFQINTIIEEELEASRMTDQQLKSHLSKPSEPSKVNSNRPSNITNEENRTTHIANFLDDQIKEFKIEEKRDIKLLNDLYTMTKGKNTSSKVF